MTHFGSPEKPEFENVVVTTTLYNFIARIIGNVVMFVLLEQVVGAHSVAVIQKTLRPTR